MRRGLAVLGIAAVLVAVVIVLLLSARATRAVAPVVGALDGTAGSVPDAGDPGAGVRGARAPAARVPAARVPAARAERVDDAGLPGLGEMQDATAAHAERLREAQAGTD